MHDRVGTELIERAKHVNIVTYLRANTRVQFSLPHTLTNRNISVGEG